MPRPSRPDRVRLVPVLIAAVLMALEGCSQASSGGTAKTLPALPKRPAAVASPTMPSNLPPAVCAPTIEQLSDSSAIRIEAKLVTSDALRKNDPGWSNGGEHFPSGYYWVIAESGVFNWTFPRPPSTTEEPPVTFLMIYLKASVDSSDPRSVQQPCYMFEVTTGTGGPWPAWYHQMEALADIKIR